MTEVFKANSQSLELKSCRLSHNSNLNATQQHGLATPVGINLNTGIAGLTLGGGFDWLTRKHGMTIDNLIAAEVVTADGKRLGAIDRSEFAKN